MFKSEMDREHTVSRITTSFTVFQVLLVLFCPFQTTVSTTVKPTGKHPPVDHLKVVFAMPKKGFGEIIGPAFLSAIKILEQNLSVKVYWKIIDTNDSSSEIISAFFGTINDFKPHAIIGEKEGDCCETMATLAAARDTLFITFRCSPLQFASDTTLYPTFASTRQGSQALGLILHKVMDEFGWKRVAVIIALDNTYLVDFHFIKRELKKKKTKFFSYYHAQSNLTWEDFQLRGNATAIMLEYLAARARLFLLIMDQKEAEMLLRFAGNMNLTNGKYAFVVPGVNESLGIHGYKLDMKIFDGVISIDRYVDIHTPEWVDFETQIRKGFDSDEWKTIASDWTRLSDLEMEPMKRVKNTISAGYLYDAVLLWLHVLKNASAEKISTLGKQHRFEDLAKHGADLSRRARDLRFEGMTGPVVINNGLRTAHWMVSMLQNGSQKLILLYDEGTDKWTDMKPDRLIWPGGGTTAPSEPFCYEDHCYSDLIDKLVVICSSLAGVIVAILIIGFILFLLWKRMQEEKIIANWKIIWNDVTMLGDNNSNVNSSAADRKSTTSSGLGRYFIAAGTYKGATIAIKTVQRDSVNIFDRSIYMELKQMLHVKHDNINPFIGVCADAPNVCVAMMYAEKGSIQNVLADTQFEVDWEFRMSLAMDVAKGMDYLHSTPIGTHGHLTSANCVIDERWVCKVTDYGLRLFRCIDKLQRSLSDLLWTAPEMLQKKHNDDMNVYGTKPGDVYSFGIIISELLTRELPYQIGLGTISLEELLAKVKMSLEPPFRPYLPQMEGHIAAQWIGLAKNCWQTAPQKRPTFKTVKSILLANHSGKFTNVLERLQMVLEESIERANTDLMVERRKTETMLETILPRPVAEMITSGTEFEPQLSEAVTLCLCDTLGFYKATNDLPADVVIDILKSMFQQYDEIVGKYQAFEISTSVGKDSMMLAGGLPVNAKVDAEAICTMALDLLSFIGTFTHPRIESRDIQMKTTIHTGSAYAAVMGKQIPQFCVFGEVIQATSTLHTYGKAMTIRISGATRDRLPTSSGMKLERAEEVALKDYSMAMYQVIGKEGFTKPLPSIASSAPKRKSSSVSTTRRRSSTSRVPK